MNTIDLTYPILKAIHDPSIKARMLRRRIREFTNKMRDDIRTRCADEFLLRQVDALEVKLLLQLESISRSRKN